MNTRKALRLLSILARGRRAAVAFEEMYQGLVCCCSGDEANFHARPVQPGERPASVVSASRWSRIDFDG